MDNFQDWKGLKYFFIEVLSINIYTLSKDYRLYNVT